MDFSLSLRIKAALVARIARVNTQSRHTLATLQTVSNGNYIVETIYGDVLKIPFDNTLTNRPLTTHVPVLVQRGTPNFILSERK